MQTELLAPAGDKESAYSAFYFGADAVYLGLKNFSARAGAINFDRQDLDEITAYAHHLNKKVYVAVNTLMQENELPILMDSLKICVDCHVDAVIVQDLGVARIVKKYFPSLVLHASTQMAVHNLAGALALKKQGFERVVLARELSLKEILYIKEKSGLEIEVFIHGALCYSYSGLCLFSSLTTARSANRGKCVYSCRSLFETNQEKTHLFSMKDMALEKDVLKLKGISLKIEGRKKTPLYVAAVTDYYRRILDTGKVDISLTDNLKQIFARPWTKLHFQGKNKDVLDESFVGHRGLLIGYVEKVLKQELTFKTTHPIERYDGIQIDIEGMEKPFGFSAEKLFLNKKPVFEVEKGQRVTLSLPNNTPFIKKGYPIYLASSTKVKRSYVYTKPKPRAFINQINIDVFVSVTPKNITACCEDKSVVLNGVFEKAKQIDKVYENAKSCFMKTGDTPFLLKEFYLENKEGLFVPLCVLNELRRKLYDLLPVESVTPKRIPVCFKKETNKAMWSLKTDDLSLLKGLDLTPFNQVIFKLGDKTRIEELDFADKEKMVLAMPTIIRQEEKWRKIIMTFYEAGFHKWMISNIGGLSLLPPKAEIYLDSSIGMMNSEAMAYAFEQKVKGITLSVEDTRENIKKLTEICSKTSLVVYQDTELFISDNCIRKNSCSTCSKMPFEEEIRSGKDVFVALSKNCQTVVMKKTPFYIASELKGITPLFYRLDFCNRKYLVSEVKEIIKKAMAFEPIKNTFTGNFKKSFA